MEGFQRRRCCGQSYGAHRTRCAREAGAGHGPRGHRRRASGMPVHPGADSRPAALSRALRSGFLAALPSMPGSRQAWFAGLI